MAALAESPASHPRLPPSPQVPPQLLKLRSLFLEIEREFETIYRDNVQLKEQLFSQESEPRARRRSSADQAESRGHSTHSERESSGREAGKDGPSRSHRKAESMRNTMGGAGRGLGAPSSGTKQSISVPRQLARTNSSPTASGEHGPPGAASNAPAAKATIRDKIRSRGRKLVSGAVERVKGSSTAVTRVFRPGADAESVQWSPTSPVSGHSDGVWDLSGSRWEGQQEALVASASADKSARVWSVELGRELAVCLGHKGSVNTARFHPQERLLCTASGDKSAVVWRLPDDEARAEEGGPDRAARRARASVTLWGHSNAVSCAEWVGGTAGVVATAGWDKSVLLFDIAGSTTCPLRTLAGHDGPVTSVAATNSTALLLTASRDCTARLWDSRSSLGPAHVFQGHSNTVTAALFVADGRRAVTASDDCTVKVWDLKAAHTPLMTLKCGRKGVTALALAPRRALMAAALDDGSARIYDMGGGKVGLLGASRDQEQAAPAGSWRTPRYMACVLWAPDEASVLTGGFDPGLIQRWQPPHRTDAARGEGRGISRERGRDAARDRRNSDSLVAVPP